jgi:CheY-like chemotaxis protein/two-component sensor histidine kinase
MESEVLQRSRELRDALSELREAANAKDQFLSLMSHELRTPLNAILGFAQLLGLDELTDEQQEGVAQILKAGRLLLELINEVLDISRIATGQLTLSVEPVVAVDVLSEALDLIVPLAAEREVELSLDFPEDLVVLADGQRLKQVILNLLSNAVKYNKRGGLVRVETATAETNRVLIKVSDTGIGVPRERMGRLFEPFDRLGAEGSGVEGTGLGLALSKGFVVAMGGRIEVESEEGQGSTFIVELPVADHEQHLHLEETPGDLVSIRSDQRGLLLYVEDNLSNLRLVERTLKMRSGLELISAVQGRMGLELALRHQPDLVLLDLHLPDITGEEVLASLKSQEGTQHIPVIIMSADATSRSKRRLLAAGAIEYLTKPLDVRQFLDAVDRCVEVASAQ